MMNLSGFCLWYGVALGATAVITYTDVKAYWIPDAPVLALAVINILALCFGWVRPSILPSVRLSSFFSSFTAFGRTVSAAVTLN